MRNSGLVLATLAACVLGSFPAVAATPKDLESLGFLIGDWQGEGGGKPGEATGEFAAREARVL